MPTTKREGILPRFYVEWLAEALSVLTDESWAHRGPNTSVIRRKGPHGGAVEERRKRLLHDLHALVRGKHKLVA